MGNHNQFKNTTGLFQSMKKVFVSGCYDILHAGHLQFFKEAKALGDYLIVSFASDAVLFKHKRRKPSIPQDHKFEILKSIDIVDQVVIGDNAEERGLDFIEHIKAIKPDMLVVTEDDKYKHKKIKLCELLGIKYVSLNKTEPKFSPVSTSSIIEGIKAPLEVPLRVDFAGGWLDVPKFKIENSFIVNCSISPLVSLNNWIYKIKSGLGGSGAWAILNGKNGIESELSLGCGWQDPAVIEETGLCVWRSGDLPLLEFKRTGDFLNGKMALYDTQISHDTPQNLDNKRDFNLIKQAGDIAHEAVIKQDINLLASAVNLSYKAQLGEGMGELSDVSNCIAKKYCGGGWGGYALYLFDNKEDRENFSKLCIRNLSIEPYIK
jgi:cytidyltransferase-like protein